MKKQTLTAGGLAVTMALALSACGGQTKEETKAETPAATEQAAAGESTASGETKDFFPLSDSVTVTIAGARDDSETPLGDRQFFKDMEEKTNLKVDWIDWPQSQVTEKRNLAFAGGELPDAMMGNFILDTASLVKGMTGMEFTGVGGKIKLDENGDAIKSIAFNTFVDGKVKWSETLDSDGNLVSSAE